MKHCHDGVCIGFTRIAMKSLRATWVHSSVVRAVDCRSAGPWFKSGCALFNAEIHFTSTAWKQANRKGNLSKSGRTKVTYRYKSQFLNSLILHMRQQLYQFWNWLEIWAPTGDWTQDLQFTRLTLYHWAIEASVTCTSDIVERYQRKN